MSAPIQFVPFHYNRPTEPSVLGYRADANFLELTDEANLRQSAALQLLEVLSGVEGFTEAADSDLAGCFLAVRLLVADAKALHAGACEYRRRERSEARP